MPDIDHTPSSPAAPHSRAGGATTAIRTHLRKILLVGVPLVALAAGVAFYLMGGRYVSTDNAYVGAQKVLITPDVSGKIAEIRVREGEHVAAGAELLRLDRAPFEFALAQAQAKLATVRTDFAKLKANYKSLVTLADLATKNVDLKQHDVERKKALVARGTGSPADLDTAAAGMVTAQLQSQYAEQQRDDTLTQLLGAPDLAIEKFPPFMQARAVLDQAERDLDHTVLRAPIAGAATQVDAIQLGRFVAAGTPILAVVDDAAPWVDANPKETDITYLRVGQKVAVEVDAFPSRSFHGTVAAVSPGTGAQFSILPPQNASGNWVKVVQRVPVRIVFDRDEDTRNLRAGMSVTVDIDTGRRRSFASLVGLTSVAQERQAPAPVPLTPRQDRLPPPLLTAH